MKKKWWIAGLAMVTAGGILLLDWFVWKEFPLRLDSRLRHIFPPAFFYSIVGSAILAIVAVAHKAMNMTGAKPVSSGMITWVAMVPWLLGAMWAIVFMSIHVSNCESVQYPREYAMLGVCLGIESYALGATLSGTILCSAALAIFAGAKKT
ncbi:MAG: hypothetical protein JXX14_11315, partial [Deltaproteobacteria bacterium]|nr:hypothetical protein [Deltaproteobacteria bacterium]